MRSPGGLAGLLAQQLIALSSEQIHAHAALCGTAELLSHIRPRADCTEEQCW